MISAAAASRGATRSAARAFDVARGSARRRHRNFGGSARTTRVVLSSGPRGSRDGIPPYVWIIGGVPIAGSAWIYYRYLDTVPLSERQRWIATSPTFEQQLGDQEYGQLRKQFASKTLPRDHPASVTVERVGRRICRAAEQFANDHDLPYRAAKAKRATFTVVRSDTANAFVLPGNHVFVMTGLFKYARDEDELASVLGHEMAHNLARHVGEKISGGFVTSLLASLSLIADPSGSLAAVFLPAVNILRDLPHSRTQEAEADRLGMMLAAMACYDPQAAQRVFKRMEEDASGRQPPEFLSTHPTHESRIRQMAEWLPESRKVLHRGDGMGCENVRYEMAEARRIAAQRRHQRA